MSLWKAGVLLTFGVITGICVSYAHSAPQQSKLEWESSVWLGGCRLKAEPTDHGYFAYTPTTESRTKFEGIWPSVAGDMYLESSRRITGQTPMLGAEDVVPDETLLVTFAMKDGRLQPTKYIYDNVRMRISSKGRFQPKHCVALVPAG